MTAPITFEIGSTLGGMVTLADLNPPVINPLGEFDEVSDTVVLGNGLVRGLGFPRARWVYGFILSNQFDQLASFVSSGVSGNVFIATRLNDDSYLRYSANMILPISPQNRAGRYIDITFEFTNLVPAE